MLSSPLFNNPIALASFLKKKHLHACAHAPPRSSINKRLPIIDAAATRCEFGSPHPKLVTHRALALRNLDAI